MKKDQPGWRLEIQGRKQGPKKGKGRKRRDRREASTGSSKGEGGMERKRNPLTGEVKQRWRAEKKNTR